MIKRIGLVLVALLFIFMFAACEISETLPSQTGTQFSTQPETTNTTEKVSNDESREIFLQGLEYANDEDWLKAYECYLSVDERELLNSTGCTEGALDSAINQCRSAVIALGKTAYDSKDYITACQYWSVCNVYDEFDYSQEYSICQLVENAQGRKYDRQNKNKTIFVDGTTIIVDGENEDIPIGEYTTYLGERTNNAGGKEWVLFFDNGKYVLKLPESVDSLITLLDLSKEFPDNVLFYYSLAGADKANGEEADFSDETTKEFTNKYGTATTKCAHTGCSNYIANSGDTNCCTTHSNRCLDCKIYIDEDAYYCVSCIAAAATPTCEVCSKKATYSIKGITGQTEYYCTEHYNEMKELLEWLENN